jgi:hypothetical protein
VHTHSSACLLWHEPGRMSRAKMFRFFFSESQQGYAMMMSR